MNNITHWTKEEEKRLIKCVARKDSKEMLLKTFPNRSYAAILGKIHRMGLHLGVDEVSEETLKRFITDINRVCITASEYCLYEYDLKKNGDEFYSIHQTMRNGGFCPMAVSVSKREAYKVLKEIRDVELRSAKLKYNEYEQQLKAGNMEYLRQQFTLLKSCIETLERY